MKDAVEGASELQTKHAAASASAAPPVDMQAFEDAWDDAAMDSWVSKEFTSSADKGPSTLSAIAQRTSDVFVGALGSLDFGALSKMPTVELLAVTTQYKINTGYAKALVDTSWGVVKAARQAVDSVMNNK